MAGHDPRIDADIARQAEFAQPILERIRAIVHEACPEVEETMKWSMPSFVYAGGILCTTAAFKQHAAFWKHALVMGEEGAQGGPPGDGPKRRLMHFHPATSASTSNGWQKASRATGNTWIADCCGKECASFGDSGLAQY